MNRQFAIFILSHGRANNVRTLKALKDCGYTGKTYIVIDDEDDQADEYFERYGESVIQFHKQAVVDKTDTIDMLNNHCAVIYARNKVFDIAKELGITHFLMLDDDIKYFVFRYIENNKLHSDNIKNFDGVCNVFLNFLDCYDFYSIGFFGEGDYFGGINGIKVKNQVVRKMYNTFFCRTDRPINFLGTVNEDFCTSISYNNIGKLLISLFNCECRAYPTYSQDGGMAKTYNKNNLYVNYFYPLICCPSAMHMSVSKNKKIKGYAMTKHYYPMILNEKFKKR